jgi:uncharacterized membrane protein/glutaredoxin
MGKKAKARRESIAVNKPAETDPPLRTAPNRPLLGLSAVGVLLSGYLTYTALTGNAVQGCSVGSACDVVLSSRWATLLGLPTAFWGLLAYAVLAGTAFVKRVDRHWQFAWTAALFGVLYSAYLTTVSLTILDAACPYCLTSLGIMTAIFALVTWQRPALLANFSWPRWLGRTVPASAAIILLLHLNYTGVLGDPPAPENPVARALAEHLTKSGVKFYGASWCPHCQDQKQLFGSAARLLPYIECSTGGQNAPQSAECQAEDIRSYPTWFINGQRVEEILSMQQLADATGFQAPPAATN